MSITADELIEKARDQRKRDRCDEALISATRAAELDPRNAEAWWQVAINLSDLKGIAAAEPALKRLLDLSPGFAYGWTQYGFARRAAGDEVAARACFERALAENPNQIDALLEMADIFEVAKDAEGELRVLGALDRLDHLPIGKLNRLGILHHDQGHIYPAISYYRRFAAEADHAAGLFNLGLAYQTPQISQRTDSIDTWRLAAKRFPDYQRAKELLQRDVPEMVTVAQRVRDRNAQILNQGQWYAHYISPFELLNIDRAEDLDLLDAKAIQRRRKALIHEIELEDGQVAWLPGLRIDRSRAIGICDELHDERKHFFHRCVFENANLLGFLSRGEIEHFLVDGWTSPLQTIELLEAQDNGFQEWLDGPFSRQFDLVLSKALEGPNLLLVEVILSGRRWVSLPATDQCFEGAYREVDRMLDFLRAYAATVTTKKPQLDDVQATLRKRDLLPLLEILPLQFHALLAEAAGIVRGISVECQNVHGDTELAKSILVLIHQLSLKSPSSRRRYEDDLAKLNEIIAEDRKDECLLTLRNVRCGITRQGAHQGSTEIAVEDIESVRGGTVVTREGSLATYHFSFVVRGRGLTVDISWSATYEVDKQEEHFRGLLRATVAYLLPALVGKLQRRWDASERVGIGPVITHRTGIEFQVAGWFFRKNVSVPWDFVRMEVHNGELIVFDRRAPKSRVVLPLATTDNALTLHFFGIINQRDGGAV